VSILDLHSTVAVAAEEIKKHVIQQHLYFGNEVCHGHLKCKWAVADKWLDKFL
jgi:hypothetical protein